MSGLIARFNSPNLTKQWLSNAQITPNGWKGFLSPLAVVMSVNRGAKIDCGIEWVRPVEPPSVSKAKSGDLEAVPYIPPTKPVPELQKSEILKNANPVVQKLFSFSFQPRQVRRTMIQEELANKVKRHVLDNNSPEVNIARMTAKIRLMQEHVPVNRREKRGKVVLKELIEMRKKRLKFLRMNDYRRFEWLLERLNMVYYPPPPAFHPVMRSVSMKQLADEFCARVKEARLAAYREELDEKKPEFLKRKMETMKAIVADESSLNVTPSFTEEEILQVGRQYDEKVEERMKMPKSTTEIF